MSGRRVGALIAALLLPPLGVFLDRGLGSDFWIATALTLLGYIPGALFALYTLLLRDRAGQADHAAA